MPGVTESVSTLTSHSSFDHREQLPPEPMSAPLLSSKEPVPTFDTKPIQKRSLSSPELTADLLAQQANNALYNLWLYQAFVQVRKLADGDTNYNVSTLKSIEVTLEDEDGKTIEELLPSLHKSRGLKSEQKYKSYLNDLADRLHQQLLHSAEIDAENEDTLKKEAKQHLKKYKVHLSKMKDPDTNTRVSQLVRQTFHYPKDSFQFPPHEFRSMEQLSNGAPSVHSQAVSANMHRATMDASTSPIHSPKKQWKPKETTPTHRRSAPGRIDQWLEGVESARQSGEDLQPAQWTTPETSPSKHRTSTPHRPHPNRSLPQPSRGNPSGWDVASNPSTDNVDSDAGQNYPLSPIGGPPFPFPNGMDRTRSEGDIHELARHFSDDEPQPRRDYERVSPAIPSPQGLAGSNSVHDGISSEHFPRDQRRPDSRSIHRASESSLSSAHSSGMPVPNDHHGNEEDSARSSSVHDSIDSEHSPRDQWRPGSQSMHRTSQLSLSSAHSSGMPVSSVQPFTIRGHVEDVESEADSTDLLANESTTHPVINGHDGGRRTPETYHEPHRRPGSDDVRSDNGDRPVSPSSPRSSTTHDVPHQEDLADDANAAGSLLSPYSDTRDSRRDDLSTSRTDLREDQEDDVHVAENSANVKPPSLPNSRPSSRLSTSQPSLTSRHSVENFDTDERPDSLPQTLPSMVASEDFAPFSRPLLHSAKISGAFSNSLCDLLEDLSDTASTQEDFSEASKPTEDPCEWEWEHQPLTLGQTSIPTELNLNDEMGIRSALASINRTMEQIRKESCNISDLIGVYGLLTKIDHALSTQPHFNKTDHLKDGYSLLSLDVEKSITHIFGLLSRSEVQMLLKSGISESAPVKNSFNHKDNLAAGLDELKKIIQLHKKPDEDKLIAANSEALEHIFSILVALGNLDDVQFRDANSVIYNQLNQAFSLHIERIEAILDLYSNEACPTEDGLSQFSFSMDGEGSMNRSERDETMESPSKPAIAGISVDTTEESSQIQSPQQSEQSVERQKRVRTILSTESMKTVFRYTLTNDSEEDDIEVEAVLSGKPGADDETLKMELDSSKKPSEGVTLSTRGKVFIV